MFHSEIHKSRGNALQKRAVGDAYQKAGAEDGGDELLDYVQGRPAHHLPTEPQEGIEFGQVVIWARGRKTVLRERKLGFLQSVGRGDQQPAQCVEYGSTGLRRGALAAEHERTASRGGREQGGGRADVAFSKLPVEAAGHRNDRGTGNVDLPGEGPRG